MSDALTLECIRKSYEVEAYGSWLSANPRGSFRELVAQDLITLIYGTSNEEYFYCLIELPSTFVANDKLFDLNEKKYHLLIAQGTEVYDDGIGYHDLGYDASEKRYLGELGVFGRASITLYKLHGIIMIVAWIGTASMGMIFARYFKKNIKGQICGKDVWFSFHVFFMVSTFLLTAIAFIIIFVKVNGWSDISNPHPILGIIVMILCLLQPIGAIFRPTPKDPKRHIFNFIHGSGGYLVHLIAVITLFYSVSLNRVQVPEYTTYIFAGYTAYYLVVHLLLTALSINDYEKDPIQESRLQTLAKNSLLYLHTGVTCGVIVALGIIVGKI